MDEGYSGELTAINLNIGDKVISSLRENDALDWVFTTEKEAVQGVKDGSYYAALVIPESLVSDESKNVSDYLQRVRSFLKKAADWSGGSRQTDKQ